jgi:hypothetical protein
MIEAELVRRLALALPRAEERPCHGTPGFYVRGKLFARLREDGTSLVVKVDRGLRDVLLDAEPDAFFLEPHYEAYPYMLVRLDRATVEQVEDRLRGAWRLNAPKKLLAEQ